MSHLQVQAQDSALSCRNTRISLLRELMFTVVSLPCWFCSWRAAEASCSALKHSIRTLDSKQPPDNIAGEHNDGFQIQAPLLAPAACLIQRAFRPYTHHVFL